MGERRGWKLFGINVGAPAVPPGTFTAPAGSNPATQGAIDAGVNQINQNIAQGNKQTPIAMGAVAGGAILGGAGGAAGSAAGGGTDTGTGNGPGDTPDVGNTSGGSGSGSGGSSGGIFNPDGSINWGNVLGDAKGLATPALQGLAIYEAAQRQKQADQYAQGALSSEQGLFNAKAPLRALGIQGMTSLKGNPFATMNTPTGPNGTNQTGGNYTGPIPPQLNNGAISLFGNTNGAPPKSAVKPPIPGTITGQVGNAVNKLLPPTNPVNPTQPGAPGSSASYAPMSLY